jgi:hypothetical protein
MACSSTAASRVVIIVLKLQVTSTTIIFNVDRQRLATAVATVTEKTADLVSRIQPTTRTTRCKKYAFVFNSCIDFFIAVQSRFATLRLCLLSGLRNSVFLSCCRCRA